MPDRRAGLATCRAAPQERRPPTCRSGRFDPVVLLRVRSAGMTSNSRGAIVAPPRSMQPLTGRTSSPWGLRRGRARFGAPSASSAEACGLSDCTSGPGRTAAPAYDYDDLIAANDAAATRTSPGFSGSCTICRRGFRRHPLPRARGRRTAVRRRQPQAPRRRPAGHLPAVTPRRRARALVAASELGPAHEVLLAAGGLATVADDQSSAAGPRLRPLTRNHRHHHLARASPAAPLPQACVFFAVRTGLGRLGAVHERADPVRSSCVDDRAGSDMVTPLALASVPRPSTCSPRPVRSIPTEMDRPGRTASHHRRCADPPVGSMDDDRLSTALPPSAPFRTFRRRWGADDNLDAMHWLQARRPADVGYASGSPLPARAVGRGPAWAC
jgi:hypothetical protein